MPAYEKYQKQYKDYYWEQITQMKTAHPIFVQSAKGSRIKDIHGKEYIDALAGLGNVILGYGREDVARSMYEKAANVPFLAPGMVDPDQVALAEKVVQVLPPEVGLTKVLFQVSGSDANEAAFKMARQYHAQSGNPRKLKVISSWMGYHGATGGAGSASGRFGRRVRFEPLMPGFIHIFPPYCYRCFFGQEYPGCGMECARQVARVIELEGPDTVSAFIAEPMTASGGSNIPPQEYFEQIDQICKKNNVLLIVDEVVTGFGRTGKMFGMSHYKMKPDIAVLAKGIAGGYAALSAVCATDKIYQAFYSDRDQDKFDHIITYGGNPISCAAGLKTLEIIEREGLVERSRQLGEYLGGLLSDILGNHPLVAFTAGKGLRYKIEVVKDRKTKEPLMDPPLRKLFKESCMEQGVLVVLGGELPSLGVAAGISPPLTIEKDDLKTIVFAIKNSLDAVKNRMNKS